MKTPSFEQSTTVTIGAGASLSGAATLKELKLLAVVTAATWDTAAITFQISFDGVTYFKVWTDAGAEYSVAAVTASTYLAINPLHFIGARYIKVQSGTTGATVNQADATIVTLIVSPM